MEINKLTAFAKFLFLNSSATYPSVVTFHQ
jgi:hypothetical protein